MGPLDYRTQVLDPIGMALQGYAQRVAQGQAERQMGQQDRALGQADRRLDMAQEQMTFEMQRARMADQQAAAARAQQDAAQKAYVDYILNPVKTSDSTAAVIRANPQLAEAVMQVWQGQNEEQRRGLAQFGMQFVYALKSGNVDAAKGLLDRRIQAAEAAGDKAQADAFRAERMQLDAGQTDVVLSDAMVTLYGGMSPKEFDDFTKSLPGAAADEPESVKALRIRAQEAGLVPGTPEYSEFMQRGGGGPQVVVNTGEKSDAAFEKKIAEGQAAMFQGLLDQGSQAARSLGQIGQLEALAARAPTGAVAAVKKWLGEKGINTEGLSDIQTFEAIVNQLVPLQRQPGSGPMSDRDLDLFKQSLPRLINQPGGNAQILATMRGIAEYTASQARIAERVVTRQLTREQGVQELMALPNPLADFAAAPAPAAPPSSAASPAPAAAPADPLASARQKLAAAVQAKGGKLTTEEARAILTEAEYRALIEATGKR